MAVEIEVVLPLHASYATSSLIQSSSEDVVIRVQESRVIWLTLYPLLFHSSKRVGFRAAQLLLDSVSLKPEPNTDKERQKEEPDSDLLETKEEALLLRRILSTTKRGRTSKTPQTRRLFLLPPRNTVLQYSFSSRLIAYEHKILQAYSISHYMSTLGGGFFFCRHYTTAAQLAVQQHAVAQNVLQDDSLAASCWIHVAYNCVYRGEFAAAERVLLWLQATYPHDGTLRNMCASAWLLCSRMRQAQVDLNVGSDRQADEKMLLTVDDYQRIRVLEDQSAVAESTRLVAAIGETATRHFQGQ